MLTCVSASEMTYMYIVSGGALNSAHSLTANIYSMSCSLIVISWH